MTKVKFAKKNRRHRKIWGKSYITDPRRSYLFTQVGSDCEPRVITGNGTLNMLANAHPGSTFELLPQQPKLTAEQQARHDRLRELRADLVEDGRVITPDQEEAEAIELTMSDDDTRKAMGLGPFDDVPVTVPDEVLEAMEQAAPEVGISEFVATLNVAQLKKVASYSNIEGRSKMNKGQLTEAIIAHPRTAQADTLGGWRSVFHLDGEA